MTTKISALRGRPRSFDPDAAVDVAMRLFHARGYDAVSVAEIGEALGIKPPSFYSAFGSKAGLFERVVERYGEAGERFAAEALAGGGSVADAIERLLRGITRLYLQCDGVAGCLVIDSTRNSPDPEARAITARQGVAGRAMIRNAIAREFPDRAEALADDVVIAMKGLSAAARDGASLETLERFAMMVARAFRRELESPAG